MAQVAIIVNGPSDPRKAELASTLGLVLGCPVLVPSAIEDALLAQTGPVVASETLGSIAAETVWRTAGAVEAGVILDASWSAGDADAVRTGILLAGSPRAVEVACGKGEPTGVAPVVRVESFDAIDMDALVIEISALFGV